MSLSPQLRPTDFEHLETISDRAEREQAFADNAIYRHDEPQGVRYTKGSSPTATKPISMPSSSDAVATNAFSLPALSRCSASKRRSFAMLP